MKNKSQVSNSKFQIPRAFLWGLVLGTWFLGLCLCTAQQSKIDSLIILLKKDKEDTNKVNHLNALGSELMYSNPDTAIILGNLALEIAQRILSPSGGKWGANSLGNLGGYYWLKADYPKAIDYYLKALKIDEELNNKSGIVKRLNNIGNVYFSQGDYPSALDYYFRALKIGEELGDKNRIAILLSSIGVVYSNQTDYSKALGYYLKALKIAEELENKNSMAVILGNIGNDYWSHSDYPQALVYFLKALNIAEELGNKNHIAAWLGNIGSVYKNLAESAGHSPVLSRRDSLYKKAFDYYFMALKIKEEVGDKNGIAIQLNNIGSLYTSVEKYAKAEKYLLDALKIVKEIGAQNRERQIEEALSNLYEKTNRYQLAIEHYKKAMALKDTLFNEEKNKEITRKEMNYEFEKKEAAAKAEADKQTAVTAAESKKQKIVIWSVIAVLLLVVLFAGFIFRALRITQKQKKVIEHQKKLVEEKQKEILDSIRYARRIQTALLPTEKYIQKHLERLKAIMPK